MGSCSSVSIRFANSIFSEGYFLIISLIVYQKGQWLKHYKSSNISLAERAFNLPALTNFKLSTASFISSINNAFSFEMGIVFTNESPFKTSNKYKALLSFISSNTLMDFNY